MYKRQEEPCVEFKNITFGYDDHVVLKNLSFAIYPGEQVTLTGRTGAGKSTIFKLLLGLYRPNSGEALIEGEEAYRIPDLSLIHISDVRRSGEKIMRSI